jgi:N-acetylneuraminic acid mutarotase
VVEDVLFVAGGRRTKAPYGTFDGVIPEIDVYHFKDGNWNSLETSLPTPRAGTFNANYDSKVYIAGGEDPLEQYAHQKVEVYDWSEKKWISFPEIPVGRHGTGMFYYDGELWTSCGSYRKGGGPELTDLWRIQI